MESSASSPSLRKKQQGKNEKEEQEQGKDVREMKQVQSSVNLQFQYPDEEEGKNGEKARKGKTKLAKLQKRFPKQSKPIGKLPLTKNLLPELGFLGEDNRRDDVNSPKADSATSPSSSPKQHEMDLDHHNHQKLTKKSLKHLLGNESLPFTESVKHLPDLKTGEDVIAHFARNREEDGNPMDGKFAPLKFVTLNRADYVGGNRNTLKFRPYDLVVVAPEQVDPREYYVMTATSILQFGGNGSKSNSNNNDGGEEKNQPLALLPGKLGKAIPTDIMYMSQWIHESTCFRVISNLGTFKYYMERKTMRKWRAAVRYIKFCRVKRKVETKFLMLKPHFSDAYRTAINELNSLVDKPAFDLSSRRACNLAQFAQKQIECLEGRVHSCVSKVGATIGQSVVKATLAMKKDMRALSEQLVRNKNNINCATKSMVDARMEREETKKKLRVIENDLRRLPEFCRMLNYYILGRLLGYIIDSYDAFVQYIANFDKTYTGVFKVLMELEEGGNGDVVVHTMNPSENEMFQVITDFCTKLLDTVDSFPLLAIPEHVQDVYHGPMYDPEYSHAPLENRMNEMTTITATCADSDCLNTTFAELYNMVEQSYREGNQFGETFRTRFEDIFKRLTSFDTDAYVAEEPDFLTLKKDLNMFQDWGKDIANMKLETKCGSLMVLETRSFKEKLLLFLDKPMQTCKDCLEGLGRDQVHELTNSYRVACTELEVETNATLNNHSSYVEAYNKHFVAQKFYERNFELIQDIYALMKDFEIKHSIEDAARLEEVSEERLRFEEYLARARNYIAAQNNSYVEKLKRGISAMEEYCEQMTLQLSREPFNDPTKDTAEMVEQLDKLQAKWDAQLEKGKLFAHQMELLVGGKKKPEDKPTVTYNYEVGPVENCRMMLEKRRSVWGCWNRWNLDYERWWNTDLTVLLNPEKNEDGLNGPQVERMVEEYFQEAVGYNRKYKGDEIVEKLLETIKVTRSRASFMVLFGHPSLRERHYQQMYTEVFGVNFVNAQGIVVKPPVPEKTEADPNTGGEGDQQGEDGSGEQEDNSTPMEEEDTDSEPEPTVPTVAEMEQYGLFNPDNMEPLEEICGAAAKEYSLLKSMDKMEEDWEPLVFATLEYKDTGTSIFRSMDEIEQTLDDQIVRTQAMRSSRYIKTMEARCVAWEKKLKELEAIISNRLAMQGTWLYLEPIFSSADICKQMPSEAKMFKKVDKLWRDSMEITLEDPSVMSVFKQEGLLPKLKRANEMLEEIQKGLADYLNAKRVFFPRFFFLSNEELLEILSETKDPKRVQPHLIKCFEGISKLEFTNTMDIKSMISSEGEIVPFAYDDVKEKVINPMEAGGCVEIWLDQIQTIMRKTVAHVFDQSMEDYIQKERTDWLKLWPGQVVLGVTQTYWTQECTKAISEGKTQEYAEQLTEYINDIIKLVRGQVPKLVRKTVSPLVVLDVHARDVTAELANLGIQDPNDFDWLCQLRYYWSPGRHSAMSGDPGTVVCKMINAERLYGYEYLGNSMRLVITPLTDRCYRTLMGAVHLDYGGAPAGPAGTGKTETTKDLGKAIAIQCVVYNCSDSLDYKAMGKFFKGLAGTGAWACFDEFNRINLEVLSVVAQQILTIQRAKIARVETFDFEGEIIKLRVTCNVFITMNPGYAGRQELPDNLKALFRDVAMMVPDYAMIGQIILYSMGYLEGFKLAKKIVMTYKLCSEQLSSQSHYDYGMRAVMAVLRAAGNLKQQFPEEDENILCLRSIIDVNLPKFLAPDVPLFNGIVSDLFPGVKLPDVDYTIMDNTIREVCQEWRLDPTDYFLNKVHEVYEMMIVRHGFMVVGLPFAGKTTSLKMLQKVLTTLHERDPENAKWTKVHTAILNPKSITMGQLYGEFDPVSHEWTDGVLAIAYRNFSTNPPKIGDPGDRTWVWFDGPVDAIWIENMNTVLDDNKKLCLMNGEMIIMSPTMSMIFEPMDLEVASPATVSRVGIIFMEPQRMGWSPILRSWLMKFGTYSTVKLQQEENQGEKEDLEAEILAQQEAEEKKQNGVADDDDDENKLPFHLDDQHTELLFMLFDYLLDPIICFLRKECSCFVELLDQTFIVTQLRMMEALYIEAAKFGGEIDQSFVENSFLFSLIWSVGAVVDAEGQEKFNRFLRDFMNDYRIIEQEEFKNVNTLLQLRNWKCPVQDSNSYAFQVPMPDQGSVFDYAYFSRNVHESEDTVLMRKRWTSWKDTFKLPQLASDTQFSDIVIPTKVTAQMERICLLNIVNAFPLLVVGPTGTGKSMYISQILSQQDQDVYKAVPVAFTAKTSANQTQEIVDSRLDKRRRGIYGPPLGSRCVVFVDDFNMPEVEEYGAQPPIEILRQLVDNGGWYDLNEKDFHQIVDTQLIGAMNPPGGSRNHITPRMLRHFSVFCVSSFDGETMSGIFNTILDWHFSVKLKGMDLIGDFKGDQLVKATLQMYSESIETLLPTPLKSHYIFNLRDFSRIIQGIMLVKEVDSAQTLKKLWVHETCRVIMDRLIDGQDQGWFVDRLDEALKVHLDEPNGLIGLMQSEDGTEDGPSLLRNLFFGNYANMDNPKKPYCEVRDTEQLVPLMTDYLEMYNSESKAPMDLVMFSFAIEHISRISRVLTMPRGNLLLVGVGGSGRQSLTRLAAFAADYSLIQVELTKNYTNLEWREDLVEVIKGAGVGPKPMVFLFSDTQIKYESFLEDINCMLNTGDVPNLFPFDSRMEILDRMQKIAKDQGIKDAPLTELWRMFLQRVRSRLHVVLAFSPIGGAFRDRLRKFPSLVTCCTIDWFFKWPKDALVAVAKNFLKDVELEDQIRSNIVDTCQYMHTSAIDLSTKMQNELRRINYVTPTSYLELIRSFKSSLSQTRDDVVQQRRRYEVGLEKLAFAAQQVGTMQQELTDLIPVLETSKKETNELMAVIEQKLPGVEAMKKTVSEEAAIVQVSADKCAAMKAECEADLAEAVPLLEDAMKALDTLKASDIQEVKALKTPPSGVVLVMSAVCIMFGIKPDKIKDPNDASKKVEDYWGPAKKNLLGDSKFLQRLKDYDKDNISEKIIAVLRAKYVNNPDFEPAKIKQASVAAYGLCKWVRAMEAYDKVAKVVAPKKEKLRQTEAELTETMEKLNRKKEELQKVVDDLSALENNLEDAKKKKQKLEEDVDLCEKKLVRAKQLIDGLGGEKTRWIANVEQLKIDYVNLTGNVLVSAGMIAYLGAFTSDYRDQVIKEWVRLLQEKSIPNKNPTLLETLGDPVSVRNWNINGLPTDSFSVDNAIILFNSRRWPLMIDPQGQANKWVRNLETPNGLKVIKLSDATYLRTIENAVQFGAPVLLENVGEELDATLEPILLKSTFKQGGVLCIRIGDNVVEYSSNFRFYITTKLRNPHYLPEISVKVTLLNFMITSAGLQDQFLTKVVKCEKPELAAEKERLIVEGAQNAAKLKDCEDTILKILSSSAGNILEDESAINVLKDSKIISDDIKEKQKVAVETEKQIDEVRQGYVPIAYHSQLLFFLIADMANIEPTYQFSLEWFGNLFVKSIDDSEPCDDLEKRLEILKEHFTYSLYKNVCRSLLEKDKLLFSFLLCVRIMQGHGELDIREWMFLLTGGISTSANDMQNPCSDWLIEKGWNEICRLDQQQIFPGFVDQFKSNLDIFRKIYDSSEPEKMLDQIPVEGLTPFQRMLLLRCIRPDALTVAIQDYVIGKMGEQFVTPPSFNLKACYEDAGYLTPLVFVLSAGSDPMTQLIKLSEEYKARIDSISLGQGQGILAEAMIDRAQSSQERVWVCLMNCHLLESWMPDLERIVENTSPSTCNRNYRLWLTTYPVEEFPISILQNSIKITLEPPRGLRANISNSYKMDPICTDEFFNSVVRNDGKEWRSLLFGLCFFHALMQERRNFGALGFNIPYEFSTSDLIISVKQLSMFLDLYDTLPFKALKYCTAECNYGGKVTDDKDRRLVNTILGGFYREEVLDQEHVISGVYRFPPEGDYKSYLSFIEEHIPLVDKPEVFGLNANANLTKGNNQTNLLLSSILKTQKAEVATDDSSEDDENAEGGEASKKAEKKTEEDVIFDIADDILGRLPPAFDMELAELRFPVDFNQCLNSVLCQELERFNSLLSVLVGSLENVKKAVRGLVVMSAQLEMVSQSLSLGQVPKLWLGASYPSLKPLAGYVNDFLARVKFFEKWLHNGAPDCFWLSGFYFNQGFLTGIMQNYARKYAIPIDHCEYSFVMMADSPSDIKAKPEDGCYVYGLFIDGARFNFEQMELADSLPKILISTGPMIHFLPKKSKDIEKKHAYACPVYRTSERRGILNTSGASTNFLLMVNVPISKHDTPEKYIAAGVAFILSTDD